MDSALNLEGELSTLGVLIGILKNDDNILSVRTDWFSDPITYLGSMGTRLDSLITLLNALLTKEPENPLGDSSNEQWYSIPTSDNEDGSIFYIVASEDTDTSGRIGLGTLVSTPQNASPYVQVYVYVPLISYSPSEPPQFITGNQDNPCQLGLHITKPDNFQAGDVNFTGLKIDTKIYTNNSPTFSLEFEGLQGTSDPSQYTSLADLFNSSDALSWLGDVVIQSNDWLKQNIGSSGKTVGDILKAAQLINIDGQSNYSFNNDFMESLGSLSGAQLAWTFISSALDALSALGLPLIPLPGEDGGIYIVHHENTNAYGIRFAGDISLTQKKNENGDGDGETSPTFDLSLGTWLTGETDSDNWVQGITGESAEPGLSILFSYNDDGYITPWFELSSVGFNAKGGGDAPLFDISGYTLKGSELRAYLNSSDWSFGFAIRLDDIGFPLGSSLDDTQESGDETNVVAKNLLASGNQPDDSSGKSTVNPTFSAKAGLIKGFSKYILEILDDQGTRTDTIWFPIQRRFGPLECKKIGLKVDLTVDSGPELGMIFDGDVSLSALDIDLDELSIDVPLKTIADISSYKLDLKGLDVSFSSGSLEISGGLEKTTDSAGDICYDGDAIIKLGDFAISAIGSYASLPDNGGTSLFIFAMLNAPLGGPPFFFITGLAAGFGYNRSLKIPSMDDVQKFPLIAGLANTSLIGGDNPKPGDVLSTLQEWVPVDLGEYWLAAGLQFTTFEIIKTNALLIVEFGNDLSISVLGVSTLKQPQTDPTFVYAELDIEVVFQPQQGEVRASAVLAPDSYIFTPDAHLTGGFAFYAWFGDNAHAGDFVFTIGGYHPSFNVPSHYPQIPRIGINWQISDSISVNGDAYFAITPVAMMAGGGLQFTFASGPLKAWFKAQADAILFWKPFYLKAEAAVSVGVSYHLRFLWIDTTLSLEIGANMDLWGPPIGGSIYIDWYIISFTINFGEGENSTGQITWEEFKDMLPTKTQTQNTQTGSIPQVAGITGNDSTSQGIPVYLTINANDGLKSSCNQEGVVLWLVRSGQFQFSVGSAVPAKTIVLQSQNGKQSITGSDKVGLPLVNGGISPEDYQSTQKIEIYEITEDVLTTINELMDGSCSDNAHLIDITDWEIDAVTSSLPSAMWGSPVLSGQVPDINSGQPTVSGIVGVTMNPKPSVATQYSPDIVIDVAFSDQTVNPGDENNLPLSQMQQPSGSTPQAVDSFADIANINSPEAVAKRTAVFTALQSMGINGWTNNPLPLMAANPGRDFADEPMEGSPV